MTEKEFDNYKENVEAALEKIADKLNAMQVDLDKALDKFNEHFDGMSSTLNAEVGCEEEYELTPMDYQSIGTKHCWYYIKNPYDANVFDIAALNFDALPPIIADNARKKFGNDKIYLIVCTDSSYDALSLFLSKVFGVNVRDVVSLKPIPYDSNDASYYYIIAIDPACRLREYTTEDLDIVLKIILRNNILSDITKNTSNNKYIITKLINSIPAIYITINNILLDYLTRNTDTNYFRCMAELFKISIDNVVDDYCKKIRK